MKNKLQFQEEFKTTRFLDFPNVFQTYFGGEEKSVLGGWNFIVSFSNQDAFGMVKPHHILDVGIPMYKFNRNTVVYGSIPKSYSTFDSSGGGLEFTITFEETKEGMILSLVYSMQKNIMRSTGVYNDIKNQFLGKCFIDVYDSGNIHVMRWTMNDIYFVGAEDVSLQYASGEALKTRVTFGCDIISYENFNYTLQELPEEQK